MDAAGQAAHLADRRLELHGRLVQQDRCPRGHLLGNLEPHRQGDESLLRAVVQVTLHTPPLGVRCLNDPRPRGAYLLELSPDLGSQPFVLQRKAGRVADHFHESRCLRLDLRVVHQDTNELAVAL